MSPTYYLTKDKLKVALQGCLDPESRDQIEQSEKNDPMFLDRVCLSVNDMVFGDLPAVARDKDVDQIRDEWFIIDRPKLADAIRSARQ